MSKTFEVNEHTGEHFPSKSRRKVRDRKDFSRSTYGFDFRPRVVKRSKVDKEI